MREWTDLDYAQAAIDMLPGTVEEMREFFINQGIKGDRGNPFQCPLARWVVRWVGGAASVGVLIRLPNGSYIRTPYTWRVFMRAFDSGRISL